MGELIYMQTFWELVVPVPREHTFCSETSSCLIGFFTKKAWVTSGCFLGNLELLNSGWTSCQWTEAERVLWKMTWIRLGLTAVKTQKAQSYEEAGVTCEARRYISYPWKKHHPYRMDPVALMNLGRDLEEIWEVSPLREKPVGGSSLASVLVEFSVLPWIYLGRSLIERFFQIRLTDGHDCERWSWSMWAGSPLWVAPPLSG